MAYSIIATITDLGRQRLAQMLQSGKSFSVDRFSMGSGGHDPLDPTTALTPDTTVSSCVSTVFGPKLITSASLISPFCPKFVCDLADNEAVAPLSNICLFGTIVFSRIPNDPELGTSFLFAQGNFPLRVKLDSEVLSIDVTVQF